MCGLEGGVGLSGSVWGLEGECVGLSGSVWGFEGECVGLRGSVWA